MERDLILRNKNGYIAKFSKIGARWTEMHVPDRVGNSEDILLGFRDMKEYLSAEERYHGAVIGRYCGRICPGAIPNTTTRLTLNESGKIHLHGGRNGFHIKEWTVSEKTIDNSIHFTLLSPDGEEGYPGDLRIDVSYTLTEDNKIIFKADATTNKRTLINITNHSFFNLTGKIRDMGSHKLKVYGDELLQNKDFLLTGEIKKRISPFEVILEREVSSSFLLRQFKNLPNATLYEPFSGRFLKVFTNQPSLQLYNGFFMTGKDVGKTGIAYTSNSGIAIEPQFLVPGSLRTMNPGENYNHTTVYEFGVKI